MHTYSMLLTHQDSYVQRRSTATLSTIEFGRIPKMLGTSGVLATYERQTKPKNRSRRFPALAMFALILYGEAKGLGPLELEKRLEARGGQHILKVLGFNYRHGRYYGPKHSWISEFKNNEFPVFRHELEAEIAEAILARACEGGKLVFTADSTPLEASRYSKWADYNGHYRIRMAKSHLIMVNGLVLSFLFTNGNYGDNPAFLRLLEKIDLVNLRNGKMRVCFLADGAYDSAEAYAAVYKATGLILNTNVGVNAVLHEEGEWENFVRRYQKHRNEEGYRCAGDCTRDRIVRYMINHGDSENAGWHLRNLDMKRPEKMRKDMAKGRHICETVHHGMKRWVDYTVRGLHSKYIGHSLALKTMACQLLGLIFKPYTG